MIVLHTTSSPLSPRVTLESLRNKASATEGGRKITFGIKLSIGYLPRRALPQVLHPFPLFRFNANAISRHGMIVLDSAAPLDDNDEVMASDATDVSKAAAFGAMDGVLLGFSIVAGAAGGV